MSDDVSDVLRELENLADSKGKHPLDLCPEEIGRTAAKARNLISAMLADGCSGPTMPSDEEILAMVTPCPLLSELKFVPSVQGEEAEKQ